MEDWLGRVEEAMAVNLKKLMKAGMHEFMEAEISRESWCVDHCSQVVLTVSQIMWCQEVTEILNFNYDEVQGEINDEDAPLTPDSSKEHSNGKHSAEFDSRQSYSYTNAGNMVISKYSFIVFKKFR